MSAIDSSPFVHGPTLDNQDNGFKQFLDENVDCVCDFAIREGEPALELELRNGDHLLTPVQVKQPKPLVDDKPVEHVVNVPVSELLDLDSIQYCGSDTDNAPGVVLRKGSLEVWTPIAARLRPRTN